MNHLSKKERFEEILESLKTAIEVKGQAILPAELEAIAKRLVPYSGMDLFRIITALPGERYFPSGFELENRIRAKLGKPALKGLTLEAIEKNEQELVVAGQSPAKAAAGAAILKKTLRAKESFDLGDFEEEKENPLALDDF